MKNRKLLMVLGVVLTMVMAGVFLTACGGGGGDGDPTSVTYTSTAGNGDTYTLKITSAARAAYSPQAGDSFVLTIAFAAGGSQVTNGTVASNNGSTIVLANSAGIGGTITVTISSNGEMTKIQGTITAGGSSISVDLISGGGSNSGGGNNSGGSTSTSTSVTYVSEHEESYNTYTLTFSGAAAAVYTPKVGDNWLLTTDNDDDDVWKNKTGKIKSISGNVYDLGTVAITGKDDNGVTHTANVEVKVTITSAGMTKIVVTGKDPDTNEVITDEVDLVPAGSSGGGSSGGGTTTTVTIVTGTRYVYVMPDWGYLNTLKFDSGTPAGSGSGTAYFEAGANHISCPFSYTLAGDTLTINWPDYLSPYPSNIELATPQQSVAATINNYANTNDFLAADITDLARPREFTMINGNVVGTSTATILVTTTQSFVFEKKQ